MVFPTLTPLTIAPILDLTVRVGCRAVYEAAGPATLLLNLRPRTAARHVVAEEAFRVVDHSPLEEYVDDHGNRVSRVALRPGLNEIVHDALIRVSSQPDNSEWMGAAPLSPGELPPELLRYTLPSRYCDSDKLGSFAWQQFGHLEPGVPRVTAISEWIHRHIEYRYMSGRPDLSAWDVLQRGYGVCRDFAHLAVALNRTFNLPARYVTGHLPDVGCPDPDGHMDFHAYGEVYAGNGWYTTDPRFHVPRIGRITVATGFDAVDGAFSTIYGSANLMQFEVWAYQVAPGAVRLGDPIDLSVRLDNRWDIVRAG